MESRRVLLISASMGGGHDAAAAELAGRLTARGDRVSTVDLLSLLPAGSGWLLRAGYAAMLRRAPWLYEAVYRRFLDGAPDAGLSADPLVGLLLPRLRALLRAEAPDAVVPLWHVAASAVGRLRAAGQLTAPSTVVVTELVVHRSWVHPANDRYVVLHEAAARQAARRGARDPIAAAPLVLSLIHI